MFSLEKPTKAKLQKTDDKAIKVGQKDTRPAVIPNLSVHLPNAALDMFDPGLRSILYGKGSPGEKALRQAKIEGVEEVSDLPSLTRTGLNLTTLNWGEENYLMNDELAGRLAALLNANPGALTDGVDLPDGGKTE